MNYEQYSYKHYITYTATHPPKQKTKTEPNKQSKTNKKQQHSTARWNEMGQREGGGIKGQGYLVQTWRIPH